MTRLRTFLRIHGEALFFGAVFALGLCIATGVIGPTLDARAEIHASR
ncbi:hypothetical protein [Bordetella genomosp. 11]|nr:hypothetical protein [Bordetella genomosp. 11]